MRSRSLQSTAAALVLSLGFTACARDAGVAPEAGTPLPVPQLRVTIDRMAPDSTSADFTVTSTGGTFRIGPHAIYFPPRSICNPTVSSYGPTEWDKPCVVQNAPIQIHAEVRKIDGREMVDFTPALRFVPAREASSWVWIWMRSSELENDATKALNAFNILWSPSMGAEGVDESLADPTLKTRVWPYGGVVYRRIKHFSGYQVSMGAKLDLNDDGTGVLGGL